MNNTRGSITESQIYCREVQGRVCCSVTLAIMRLSPWLQHRSLWYVEVAVNKICAGPLLRMTFIYLPAGEREAKNSLANSFSGRVSNLFTEAMQYSISRKQLMSIIVSVKYNIMSKKHRNPFFTAFQCLFHHPHPLDYIPNTKKTIFTKVLHK